MVAELCRLLLLLSRFRGKPLVLKKLLPLKNRWNPSGNQIGISTEEMLQSKEGSVHVASSS